MQTDQCNTLEQAANAVLEALDRMTYGNPRLAAAADELEAHLDRLSGSQVAAELHEEPVGLVAGLGGAPVVNAAVALKIATEVVWPVLGSDGANFLREYAEELRAALLAGGVNAEKSYAALDPELRRHFL